MQQVDDVVLLQLSFNVGEWDVIASSSVLKYQTSISA